MDSALTLLVHRAGGHLAFTEAEYQAVVAQYGDALRMNIHMEVIRESGRPDTVHLKIQNRPPANAELPA